MSIPVRHLRKRSVLMVGNFLSQHFGTTAVCEELAARLAGSGWGVTVTSTRRARLPRLLDMLATAFLQGSNHRVAHVDVFSGPAFFWAEAVCWVLRCHCTPYVLTLHGGNLPQFAKRTPARVARLFRSAARVTAPSSYLARALRHLRPNIQVLPNALDTQAFAYRPRRRLRAHLIWVRAFRSIYNPSLAPRILARLVPRFPEAALTMVGPDRQDGSLEATLTAARRLGVSHRIQITGKIAHSSLPNYLGRADVFLNTSDIDNTPRSVLEAMACGLPVVSSAVGGVPELLNHRFDSLLVPPGNPSPFARAIGSLLSNPEFAARLAANAIAKVRPWGWPALLPRWERLLLEAADGGQLSPRLTPATRGAKRQAAPVAPATVSAP